ncbi:hypothetical protein [Aestuariivirga litoralis]|uniref:hypothetical protein n=1 Tax=Aestuariivirga litoralis TaxID=2650924 RepID=UPI0018C7B278|nr:hypothetical protein [Aestuariivirga litoralis]MBG1233330.1 hypothetical protein [Aestuariivirga litoralis]
MFQDVKKTRQIVGIAALVLWLASLALPAAVTTGDDQFPGFLILLMGFFGPFILQPGWYANPLFLFCAAWLIFCGGIYRFAAAIIAVLALWSFSWDKIVMDNGDMPISHFGSGFYAWELALMGLSVYAFAEPWLVKSGRLRA